MSPQAGWILQEEVVPRLRASIPRNVSYVGAEDSEELIQDATAMAAKLLDSAENAGKKVTSGNIAYYTILHMKSGRRSTGSSVVDVMGIGTQLKGNSRMSSLEEPAATDVENGGEIFMFNDVFSQDAEDPSQIAARKMDWEAFCLGLNAREQAVIECILEGRNLTDVAVQFGVCPSTIVACKQRLVNKILDYMGPDILQEIRRLPGWKDGLNCNRERLVCKYERRH